MRLAPSPRALALLPLLLACDPTSDGNLRVPQCLHAPVTQPALQASPSVYLPGESADVALQALLPRTDTCVDARAPATVRLEVSDPDNLPVGAQHVLEVDGPEHAVVRVRFPLGRIGSYHVKAVFEPVGGVVQMEVPVAEDRSTAPRLVLPHACRLLDRTHSGAWVCDGRVLREGATVDALPGEVSAVHGDRVWVLDAQRGLALLEDRGEGPLVPLASAPAVFPPDQPVRDLVPGADRLVAWVGQRVFTAFVRQDGSLSVKSAPAPMEWGSGPGLLLSADGLVAIAQGVPSQGGGRFARVCPWTLSPDAPPAQVGACAEVQGTLLGTEPDGAWFQESPFSGFAVPLMRFHRVQAGHASLVAVGTLPPTPLGLFPGISQQLREGDARLGWVLPHVSATGAVVLERHAPVSSSTGEGLRVYARAGFAWVPDAASGTTTVILR